MSATTSSFIFDGTILYAWQDDSIFDYADDGAPYNIDVGTSSRFFNGTANRDPYPLVSTTVLNQLAGSAVSSFSVNYGVPEFVADQLPVNEESTWIVGRVVYSGLTVMCVAALNTPQPLLPTAAQPLTIALPPLAFPRAPPSPPPSSQRQQLQDFPMDTQTISLNLFNSNVKAADMRFVTIRETARAFPSTTVNPPTSPDGYNMQDAAVVVGTTVDGNSALSIQWRLKRIPDFFLNRFILPLSLVSIMLTFLMSANPVSRVLAGCA